MLMETNGFNSVNGEHMPTKRVLNELKIQRKRTAMKLCRIKEHAINFILERILPDDEKNLECYERS